MVSSTNVCVYLVIFIGMSTISHGSLVIYDRFDDFVLRHRQSIRDLVNLTPFELDPFQTDPFFQIHDLDFPRIHWPWPHHHLKVLQSSVTRNDKSGYQLSVDVEGFDPEDFALRLIGRELFVTEHHTCRPGLGKPCFQRKLCWRRTLPQDVDLASLKATLSESNVLEIDLAKDKAYGGRNIKLSVRKRPEHISKRKTENSLEHAQTVTREPMEEEVSVEVVPEDTEDLKTDN
ncbi:PREDICTED: uncharacterized protein LOC107348279 [Acropora digitifera]|uniref:uncharacterized protein LOC107348279 n=1 Tax=Acropora digitifera TaxID=70779 RepID=UPI00077AC0A0|nr:PREDICTED: uncharacterized protein LOC107348279 [Acropora digitifera]